MYSTKVQSGSYENKKTANTQPDKLFHLNNSHMEKTKELADLITAHSINTKEVLTTEEAAMYLGVSKSCLYKWTMSRAIPHYKSPTGKMCFFNRKELEIWMQSNRVATDEELTQQAQSYNIKKGGKS